MDALIRKVNTYGGYAEHWSDDGRLSIEYFRPRSYDVAFDGEKWRPVDFVHDFMRSYLVSAAVFAEALDKCRKYGCPFGRLPEFLPEDKSELIPSELLRLLLDDCGLGIQQATDIVLGCFGAQINAPVRDWLHEMQPRTAHLESVLKDALRDRGLAFHDAYDPAFRSPCGAVEEGTEITFSLAAFGGVKSACLCVCGDGFSAEIPMDKTDSVFTASFSPPSPADLRYRFRLDNAWLCLAEDGHRSRLCTEPAEGFRLTVYKRGFETPGWFSRSVMYQIFPDRFGFTDDGTAQKGIEYHRLLGQTPELHKSTDEPVKWQARAFERDYAPDDFYGGNLRGIAKKLPYLKELGVGVIYLNPIVEARSNHRYDTSDYRRVDPILGSNEDYVNLCAEARSMGIRIINDGVFSHTGADSIYFNRFGSYESTGAYQGKSSPYYGWYDFRHFPDDYRCWWNFKDLPEVNENDPKWQEYIISGDNSVVKQWLRAGADGWRIDVADELPDEVLSLIRCAAKEVSPDSVIIGEVWEDAVSKESYGKKRNYALGFSLDSVMNYPFRKAVIAFAQGKSGAFELRDFLMSQQHNYPAPMYVSLMNLLGSHDVERLHTALAFDYDVNGLDRSQQSKLRPSKEQSEKATALQKLCAAIQYCVPGVPCLYYGDEECLDGARDPFNRAPFEPSGAGLHNFYTRLGELRNASPALHMGSMKVSAPDPNVIVIEREYDGERRICIVNRSEEAFNLPKKRKALLSGEWTDLVEPISAEIFE